MAIKEITMILLILSFTHPARWRGMFRDGCAKLEEKVKLVFYCTSVSPLSFSLSWSVFHEVLWLSSFLPF